MVSKIFNTGIRDKGWMMTDKQISEKELAEYHQKLAVYEEQMKSGWENWLYNEFLDLVTDRLAPNLKYKKPICPFCNSKKVSKGGHTTTLIGHFGGGPDPNHQWVNCTCKKCKEQWTMEYNGHHKYGYNVWYTKDRKVLRGLPTCFEGYRYTCRYCGGDVHRYNCNKGTHQRTEILTYGGDGIKHFDTYFRCDHCNIEVQCSNEYYSYENPHRPVRPFDPRKMFRWKIYEEIGAVYINDFAVERISVTSAKE